MHNDNLAYHGALGDYFATHAETGSHNAYVERPAMLELIGDVAGQLILDAGCGAGHHAEALVSRSASVVALEGSTSLVAHAQARLGDSAEVRQHDLNEPLDFLADGSFDGVICALVLHHLRDRPAFLREVHRVIRPGGWFAISTSHPTGDWRHFGGSYFSEDWVDLASPNRAHTIRYQRMSLETLMHEVLSVGFTVETLVEPRPVDELKQLDPEAFDRLSSKPTFLAIRARRP